MEIAFLRIKQWLDANKRSRVLPTDQWYLNFANQVYPVIKQSPLFNQSNQREQLETALALGMYLQDAIAQSGGWKAFTECYHSQTGAYLPFYPLADSYVPDEINPEDIAFVLWTQKSHIVTAEADTYTLQDPYDTNLLNLAQQIYEQMDEVFEDAPISKEPSSLSWVMASDSLTTPSTPLPEITPDTPLTKDVEHCLEYSGGKPLLYFATYDELARFFVEVLQWDNNPDSLLSDLKTEKEFVVYANAKGMLIANNVAAYFCEAHNPMYNAERASAEGHALFCQPEACPFDLLKYGMRKGILPDVKLPFPKGKELINQHWDFIARYYLSEYYEGD